MKNPVAYYQGALDGHKREMTGLHHATASLGSGRVEQWDALVADYAEALNRIEELEACLGCGEIAALEEESMNCTPTRRGMRS